MIKGKTPTLLKVTYIRPNKKLEQKEVFQVLYKDDDGNVRFEEVPAEGDFYITKPEFRNHTYNKPEERIEKLNKVRAPISKFRYIIAKEAGPWGKAILDKSYQENNYKILDQLYTWPYCYRADFQPEFYYMFNWYEKYPQIEMPKLTKGFMDIETDLIDNSIDMNHLRDSAYSPVNVVVVILEETKEVYQFILRPYVPSMNGRTSEEYEQRYAMYEKQLKAHNELMANVDDFYAEMHKEFDETYGIFDYHLREYEKEIDLITDVFRLINTKKPNFMLIWNMRFDIQYLYYRIINLGYDPVSIMCHPDIPNPQCYFKEDRSTFILEKQYDFFHCSSYTQYLCQMRNFCSIRKSQHKLQSYSLNSISDIILKDKKVEYPENANIVRFPYEDWRLFLKYNIKDSLLQYGIEKKTKDVETYYNRAHANMTPYNKIYRETHLLRNVRELYFERDGWVQGNNLNTISKPTDEYADKFYGNEQKPVEEKASFKGAINAEPSMNMNIGEVVLGRRTNNIFHNSADMDMGAFYPSLKICSNMDPITLTFKASFINDEFISEEFHNRSLNQQYEEKDKNGKTRPVDITGEAVNTYASGNFLTFMYNYFGLPNVTQLYHEVKKMLNKGS